MADVAIIVAPGFEEGEGLALADVMRRAEAPCDLVGLGGLEIVGGHDIAARARRPIRPAAAQRGLFGNQPRRPRREAIAWTTGQPDACGAVPGSVYKPSLQPLSKIRIAINVVGAGGIGACLFNGWRNHKKRKAERQEAAVK